jgi:hypothetical protein
MAEAIMQEQDEAAGAAATGTGEEPFEYEHAEGSRPDDDQAAAEVELPPRNGNGKRTLADLAQEAPDAEEGTEDDGEQQPRLFGTESKVTSAVKGKKPETSAIKFKAAQTVVNGQFHFDDVVELRVVAQLDKVEFVSKRDNSGKIVSVKRVHHASSVAVEQINLPPELLRRRLEFVADALGVDADALASAQERAAVEVE